MEREFLNGFQEDKKNKVKRSISIDYEIDQKLKSTDINVSNLVNEFLKYWYERRIEGGKK